MAMIDELISLESISLARFKTTTVINGASTVVNIFQNIENEDVYVYGSPERDKYFIYSGQVFMDLNGGYFFDTPNEVSRVGKVEYKKILRFINSGIEIILTKERVVNMIESKFFNYKQVKEQDVK